MRIGRKMENRSFKGEMILEVIPKAMRRVSENPDKEDIQKEDTSRQLDDDDPFNSQSHPR